MADAQACLTRVLGTCRHLVECAVVSASRHVGVQGLDSLAFGAEERKEVFAVEFVGGVRAAQLLDLGLDPGDLVPERPQLVGSGGWDGGWSRDAG